MNSKIILEDLKIYVYHGVLPEENIIGTYYLVNAELEVDLWKAAESDELADSVSYADINDLIHEEMKIKSKLLEHVAGRIISRVEREFSAVKSVKLKITKTSPPMKGECKAKSLVVSSPRSGGLRQAT